MGGDSGDYPAEFRAGDEGEGRLVLVFAAYLEEVEEVCAAGLDGYGVLVGFWGWGWDCGDLQAGGVLG